jgi:hypothetical protein
MTEDYGMLKVTTVKLRQEANRDVRVYRLLLLEELNEKAKELGLHRSIKAPDVPDRNSEFSLVVFDLIHLIDHLPAAKTGYSFMRLKQQIGLAMAGCRTAFVRDIPEEQIYRLMRRARRRVKTHQKTDDDLV